MLHAQLRLVWALGYCFCGFGEMCSRFYCKKSDLMIQFRVGINHEVELLRFWGRLEEIDAMKLLSKIFLVDQSCVIEETLQKQFWWFSEVAKNTKTCRKNKNWVSRSERDASLDTKPVCFNSLLEKLFLRISVVLYQPSNHSKRQYACRLKCRLK